MPRVHYVKKARKDNPVAKRGESYYWWKFRYGGKQYSTTRPRQSQLTQSPHLSMIYEAQEMIEDFSIPDAATFGDPHELAEAVRDLASEWEGAIDTLREVASNYNESADNKEEYFPGGGDEIREKADAVESSADEAENQKDEIESIASQIDDLDEEDWVEDAQNLLDQIPTELEVEVY